MFRGLVSLSLSLSLSLLGCDACDDTASLRVEGAHPFVRCLDMDPGEERTWTVGALSLALEDRVLTITGAPAELALAVVDGPAPAAPPLDAALASLREEPPTLAVALGDLGDTREALDATLAAFAGVGVPVLAVPGGRDDAETWRAAFAALDGAARDRVIDAAGIHRIVVGRTDLLPVAGAPGGRYARVDGACGYRTEDLEARAAALGAPADGASRILLSWAAPSGGSAIGIEGADAGDVALAELVRSARVRAGFFAWPREAVRQDLPDGADDELRFIGVPRIAGPAHVRADGSRVVPSIERYTVRDGAVVAADPG